MAPPGAARRRPWFLSGPARWLVKAAVAAAEEDGLVACAVDALLRGFGALLLVRANGLRIVPSLGRWIGGEEGCAVAILSCAAAARASSILLRLTPLAVPLFLLRTLGRALIHAEEEEGGSLVKEVSTVEDHPESKVEWRQMAKHVNLSIIASVYILLFFLFISNWMLYAIENGCGIPTFVSVPVGVGCLGACIVSTFIVLKKLISEVCGCWSSWCGC